MPSDRYEYDPDRGVDATWWAALDEMERIQLVEDYHREQKIQPGHTKLHAITHVVIENQVLLGDEIPVAATLDRLMNEGLSRHDAVHAIGSVFAPFLYKLLNRETSDNTMTTYYKQLHELTAKGWLAQHSKR